MLTMEDEKLWDKYTISEERRNNYGKTHYY